MRLTVEQVAVAFCELSDDEQTRFFGAIAMAMQSWLPHQRRTQLVAIGRHLVDCACGGRDAREVVTTIYESMMSATADLKKEQEKETSGDPAGHGPAEPIAEGSR